ncbi:MAG: energy transducer TonB [Lysobacterales bacterium]
MNRPTSLVIIVLLSLICGAVRSESGMFVFPHIDLNQTTHSPRALSFGTLLEPTPPGVDALREIPSALLYSHMDADNAVRSLLQEGFSTSAVQHAKQQLATLEQSGPDGPEPLNVQLFHLRLTLGVALYVDGQPEQALPLLKQGVEGLRRQEDWFGKQWLGPLIALGLTEQSLGRHRDANRSLSRAQLLIQRHYGARDPRQLPLLLARADATDAEDETFDTGQLYRTHLKIVRQDHSPHSTQQLASVHLLSEWLVDNGQFKQAISEFNQLLDAQQAVAAAHRQPAVELATLTALSQIYLRQGNLETDRGLRLARRASQMVMEQPAAFEPLRQSQIHAFTADWLTLFGRRKEAARFYALAWKAAGNSPNGAYLQRQMATPQMIFDGPEVPLVEMGYQWANDHAFANFRMSIRADGRPARVYLTDTNMHGTTIRLAQQLMRKARFRPAIVDGKPVSVDHWQHNRIYNTEPFEGFGTASIGGLQTAELSTRPLP